MGRNLNLSVFSRNYEGNKFASCANSQVALCADKWLELLPARFYRQAAEGFTDADSRQKLFDLAAMEDEHERVFHSMRADFSGKEGVVVGFDP